MLGGSWQFAIPSLYVYYNGICSLLLEKSIHLSILKFRRSHWSLSYNNPLGSSFNNDFL